MTAVTTDSVQQRQQAQQRATASVVSVDSVQQRQQAQQLLCRTEHPRPARASHGTLCRPCHDRAADELADLPRLWWLMRDLLMTGRNGGGGAGPSSTAPARLDVLAIADPRSRPADIVPVAALLARWARELARAEGFTYPPDTTAQIALLSVHLARLERRPDADEFVHDLHAMVGQLRHIVGESRAVIARCDQLIAEDVTCDGPLFYQPHREQVVVCAECGHGWSAGAVRLVMAQADLAAWLADPSIDPVQSTAGR